MSAELDESITVTEENIKVFIAENMKRAEKKYSQFTNYVCQECNAIVDINSEECPNSGSRSLAGLYTDGK